MEIAGCFLLFDATIKRLTVPDSIPNEISVEDSFTHNALIVQE